MTRNDRVAAFAGKAQERIRYCLTCQPYDSGEAVWIFGDRWDMEDLLKDTGVPEALRDEVVSLLECPGCGCSLEKYSEVGLPTRHELEYEAKIKSLKKRFYPKLQAFAEFLERFPYLGGRHPFANQIIQSVKKLPRKEITNEQWFRARSVRGEEILSSNDLLPPDPTKVAIREGRYNHYGQSHFYLADSQEGAALEVLAQPTKGIAWVQKYKITKASDVLDVTFDLQGESLPEDLLSAALVYSSVLSRPVGSDQNWKPEYFVPRFVADAIKHEGYNGLVFSSNEFYHKNLVIFDVARVSYEFVDSPQILIIDEQKGKRHAVTKILQDPTELDF